jgi:hypothetical protein
MEMNVEKTKVMKISKQNLRIFEHRILRKIFGPVQNEDGSWRIGMNYELGELVKNADIVRFIKSRRVAWLGHVMQMDEKRTPKGPIHANTSGDTRIMIQYYDADFHVCGTCSKKMLQCQSVSVVVSASHLRWDTVKHNS